jgi:predicted  nucleic acid-binding Zn-ribbon protein
MAGIGRIGAKLTGEEVAQNSIAMLQKQANTAKGLTGTKLKLAESLGLVVPKKENPMVKAWNVAFNNEGQKTFQPDSAKVAQFAKIHDERQTFKNTQKTNKANVKSHQQAINDIHADLESTLGNLNREQTGASFSLDSLRVQVNLPVDGNKKQALFKTHDELTKLNVNLLEAENKLTQTQNRLKNSSTAKGVIEEQITSQQRQVETLKNQVEGKRKAIKNILLKDADNQGLEEQFDKHSKGVKDSEAEIDLARKMLEANAESGGKFIGRKPVPPVVTEEVATPPADPVVTANNKEGLRAKIKADHKIDIKDEALVDVPLAGGGTKQKKFGELTDEDFTHGTISYKVVGKKTKTEEDPNIISSWASWFRGVKDGKVVEKGEDYTGWANTRTALTAVAGLVGLKSIWNWLFPSKTPDEFNRELLMTKARGGAV